MVSDDIKIAVVGGDRRQIYALAALLREGRNFSCIGLPEKTVREVCGEGVTVCENIEQTLSDATFVLLPFPTSPDGVRITCPLDSEGFLSEVKLATLLRIVPPSAVIIGGKLPPAFVMQAKDKGFCVYDMLTADAFEIKNAYITAEAAISIAMNSLSKNICGSRIAITGFGRISKQLARLLLALGADVSVAARKERDLAFAETLGCKTIKIEGDRWSDVLVSGFDVIYNTVPSKIFDREFLLAVDKKTLLVELASMPGGFDICAVHELGANLSWALSLPGKYAPESAGKIVAECAEKIISGEVSII